MYKIKAILKLKTSPKKYLLEGVFIPKENECPAAKIRKQCHDFIVDYMVKGSRRDDLLDVSITYTKITTDFIVVEDKPMEPIPAEQ